MTPCRSNNSTSPLPSPLHRCLAEAPMQSMIWAGEAGQEQGQEEKVFSLSMNFKLLMCPLRNLERCSDHTKRIFLCTFEFFRSGSEVFDNIKRMLTLTAITLSGVQCSSSNW
ncbi:hypothetical protein AVEN_70588-1 [Araneus ventricosus]|uniref:Uncharacterized protein n=1 Tax=Araneus ventricosus TaxID=182803 RepID=A0A4Y2CHE7_ARAVE|nr:hypothetical protein AVEN_70588-1 [Araneus ventricosus]